jgi:hypothetical protein
MGPGSSPGLTDWAVCIFADGPDHTKPYLLFLVIMLMMKDCRSDRLSIILEPVLFIVLVVWIDLGERQREGGFL